MKLGSLSLETCPAKRSKLSREEENESLARLFEAREVACHFLRRQSLEQRAKLQNVAKEEETQLWKIQSASSGNACLDRKNLADG